ncbi:MAG: hypothetical protein KDE28_25890 [Anaerolineales bacterium]|nr:hypothetical protein [Anaerolineales bacterium]
MPSTQAKSTITIYQHYDLLYWWVVWLYSSFCFAVTYIWGKPIDINGHTVKIYSDAWLGVSFVFLVLFVAVFTNLRARGAMSAILVLALVVAAGAIEAVFKWQTVFNLFPLLKVHMNLSFYGTITVVLFPIWLITTTILNRLQYYSFHGSNNITIGNPIAEKKRNFIADNIEVSKLPDDIFVHRLLGLWWLGGGTGDVEIRFTTPSGGTETHIIKNVWRVGQKLDRITRTISKL